MIDVADVREEPRVIVSGATIDVPPPAASSSESADGGGLFRWLPDWSLMQWLGVLLLLGSIAWASWATRELLALRQRQIVSVSLSTILRDFISTEASRGQTEESARQRTKAFLTGVDRMMQDLRADGKIVLLTEAVAGNTVPDVTPQIMSAVRANMASEPMQPAPSPALPSVPDMSGPRMENGTIVEPAGERAGQ